MKYVKIRLPNGSFLKDHGISEDRRLSLVKFTNCYNGREAAKEYAMELGWPKVRLIPCR